MAARNVEEVVGEILPIVKLSTHDLIEQTQQLVKIGRITSDGNFAARHLEEVLKWLSDADQAATTTVKAETPDANPGLLASFQEQIKAMNPDALVAIVMLALNESLEGSNTGELGEISVEVMADRYRKLAMLDSLEEEDRRRLEDLVNHYVNVMDHLNYERIEASLRDLIEKDEYGFETITLFFVHALEKLEASAGDYAVKRQDEISRKWVLGEIIVILGEMKERWEADITDEGGEVENYGSYSNESLAQEIRSRLLSRTDLPYQLRRAFEDAVAVLAGEEPFDDEGNEDEENEEGLGNSPKHISNRILEALDARLFASDYDTYALIAEVDTRLAAISDDDEDDEDDE